MISLPAEFHLLRPLWLWALLPIALIVMRLIVLRFQQNFWQSHVDAHLLGHLLTGKKGRQSKGNVLLLSVGWVLGVIALAGPVWERLPSPSQRNESALVIVMDLSQSMNSRDVSPSRIESAKKQVLIYLQQAQEGSIGLVLFAQQAYLGAPLSGDYSTVKDIIKHLDTDIVPVQGSRPELGVQFALSLLQRGASHQGQVLLVTDGSHDPQALFEIALKTNQAGYSLSVLAVGTEAGGLVPKGTSDEFIKTITGRAVKATVDLAGLSNAAKIGGGEFVHLQKQTLDWDVIIDSQAGVGRDPGDVSDAQLNRWREFGLTLLYLLLPIAALGFRRGWLGCGVLFIAVQLSDPVIKNAQANDQVNAPVAITISSQGLDDWQDLWNDFNWKRLWINEDFVAYQLYQARRIEEASEKFQDPQWKGATLYRIGDFKQAEKLFQNNLTLDGIFNYGNTLAQQGKVHDAIAAYKMVLDQDVNFKDARFNLNLLEAYLKTKNQSKKKQEMGAPKPKPKQSPGPVASGDNKGKKKAKANQKKKLPNNNTPKDSAKKLKDLLKKKADQANKASDHTPPPDQQVKESQASSKGALYAERVQQRVDSSVGPAQWLNMIEDKPNELLKLKFRFQYETSGDKAQDHAQPW
ncbi:MAG: hypothetical protein COB04_09775 [Gammaproteobacteria bacterium]|nr:MAG: hypothetical protein COB04_09775 [Gammaproteobacteria bacterium]